jgi:hypothetical protein
MNMYYLVHGKDIVNATKASDESEAWNYFAAVKKLEHETMQNMGYSVLDKNPTLDEE